LVIATVHERLEPLGLAVATVHLTRVHVECEVRRRVPHLRHHVGRRLVEREQQRGEGTAQRVRRQPLGQGLGCFGGQLLVGVLDGPVEHAPAHVGRALLGAGRCCKYQRVGRGVEARPVVGQLIAQDGEEVDGAYPGLCLGGTNGDRAAREVNVAPVQCKRLSDPQAGEGERRQQGTPLAAARARVRVQLASALKQGCDVIGPIER
jgi:hypothetical protein